MNKVFHDSELPAEGQQVFSACAFLHEEFDGVSKVFLPKRADTKKFLPGVYELPGGHIDFGEDMKEGLAREIMEEFSMQVSLGNPFAVFTYLNEVKGSHTIEVVYFGKFTDPIENIKINPEDHSTFEWFSESEVIAREKEIVAEEFVSEDENDPEYTSILKGFALLQGESPAFS